MSKIKSTLKRSVASLLALVVVLLSTSAIGASSTTDDSILLIPGESRSITAEEMVQEISDIEGIPVEQVIEELNLDDGNGRIGTMSTTTFRTREYTMVVTSSYKPKLVFYYEAVSSTNWALKRMIRTSMNRAHKGYGASKQFQGEIYINIESGTSIYTEVNGDFYNNGTTSVTVGGNMQIVRGNFTLGFNVSANTSSSHYKYYYQRGRIDVSKTPVPR